MTKYYKVFLECDDFCMVCKKVSFTKNLYREIITDKIIYPQNKQASDKLTYGYLPNGLPRCYEMSNIEVKKWLDNLNKEEYIEELQKIDNLITKSRKMEIKEKTIYKQQERLAGKSIKKTLRKIR